MNIFSKKLLLSSEPEWSQAIQISNLGERDWTAITYDTYHGYFVALSDSGYVAISNTGESWTRQPYSSSVPGSHNWSGIIYDGSLAIVAIGGGTTGYISTTGNVELVNWSTNTVPALNQTSSSARWHITEGIVQNNTPALCAINSAGSVSYSSGMPYTSWTTSTIADLSGITWRGITFDGNKFVAISGNGYITSSEDFANWTTPVQIPNLKYSNNCIWTSIRYTGKKFVAIDYFGYYSESKDGINWEPAEQNEFLGSNKWRDMAIGTKTIVAIGFDGYVSTKRI